MCGLVGVMCNKSAYNLDARELNVFNQLLYSSALRGSDSTGVMLWNGTDVDTLKAAWPPSKFLSSKEYLAFLESHKGKIKAIFGHTRYATTGKITTSNAHPFLIQNITLMHNGNVLKVPEIDIKKFEVDSMALANSLNRLEQPEKTFEEFDGAVAAIWCDMRDKSLNFYRNYQRPLSFGKNFSTTFIASEKEMLNWILDRSNYYNVVINNVDMNKIFKYSLEKLENEIKPIEVIKKYSSSFSSYPHLFDDEYGFYQARKNNVVEYVPPTKVSHNNNKKDKVTLDNVTSFFNKAKETFKIAKQLDNVLILKEYGPFKKEGTIVASAWELEEYKPGLFKVKACPILDLKEPYDSVFTEATVLIFTKDKKTAEELMESPLVEVTIKSIKYDSAAKTAEDKLIIFGGDYKLVNLEPEKDK